MTPSLFPKIPGYFIVTAIYTIAAKAGYFILEDASARCIKRFA